ncbi:MAG TPA: hypothetical protein VG326_17980 [Tepidisphaeraceae bacterium]|nr:hypothetical protein [Tepidisphaeraceae bacterium]
MKLLGRPDGKLAAGERDYLDALVVLVEDHDRKNSRFVPASLTPAEALKYLAEQAEMGPTALGKVLERLTRWRP